MGQCVSHEPHRMIIRKQIAAPASLSDNPSQDNQSQQLSDVTVPADQVTPLEERKLEDITMLYDKVSKQNSLAKKSLGRSSIRSLLPKAKGSNGRPKDERNNHLSAAFNMSFNKFDVVMLDINLATEEELMTLTGITRSIAHEIIEHRNAIGAFKKVEDLALVSGVGAAKLQVIKPEICIGKKLPSSTASVATADASNSSLNGNAETASVASSPKQERARRRRREPVSINTGNMFQLMTVDGITQELAAHILHYREKKGPFKTLYDLRKVSGFNTRLISALGPYLTTEANPTPIVTSQSSGSSLQNGHVPSHRRTASLPSGPLMNAGGFVRPSSPILPISNTPAVYPSVSQFTSVLNRQTSLTNGDDAQSDDEDPAVAPPENTLRILSWNLDGLSLEKARNPGVVNVISKLLVRHHVSVGVFQGDVDPNALKELCEDINKQEGVSSLDPPYSCTTANNGVGYLHRVTLQVQGSSQANGSSVVPLSLAIVKDGQAEFTLVTCSLTQTTSARSPEDDTSTTLPPTTLIPQLVKTVMDLSPTEMIVCLADIRHADHAQYVEEFQTLGYRPTVSKGESTSYVKSTDVHNNILVSRYAQKALTGRWGVVRRGLTHILIPNGWSWNGPASLHCPVWVELKTSECAETEETPAGSE